MNTLLHFLIRRVWSHSWPTIFNWTGWLLHSWQHELLLLALLHCRAMGWKHGIVYFLPAAVICTSDRTRAMQIQTSCRHQRLCSTCYIPAT